MKLPLLNILRTSKVFAIVLGLHLFIFSLLLFHPGCQMSNSSSVDHGSSAPMGEVTSLDNATLVEPTRPDGASNVSMNEVPAPAIEPSVVSTEPMNAPVENHMSYTVQKGDSLWSIARKNGVTVTALAETNGISRNSVLKVGQTLQIPAATMAPVTASSSNKSSKKHAQYESTGSSSASISAGSTYTVKAGDSLGRIAKMSGSSVRSIKAANNLHSDTIRVGQKLKIPSGKVAEAAPAADHSAEAPVVTSTESTSTEAAPSVDTSTSSESSSVETAAPTSSDEGMTTHIVQSGESPAVIAKKYGMKTSEVIALNNITDPRKLKIGQELKVKAPAAAAVETTSTTDAGMSVEALDAATSTTSESAAPVVEVKPASTLE